MFTAEIAENTKNKQEITAEFTEHTE